MLCSQKNLLVGGQRLFQRPHARFPPHDERCHHVRKNDHIPNWHHRELLCLEFFFGCGHLISVNNCYFCSGNYYPAFSITPSEAARLSTISRVTSNSLTFF